MKHTAAIAAVLMLCATSAMACPDNVDVEASEPAPTTTASIEAPAGSGTSGAQTTVVK